jgi:hypothetical protein
MQHVRFIMAHPEALLAALERVEGGEAAETVMFDILDEAALTPIDITDEGDDGEYS